jgi:hypothetical protein
MSTHAIKNYRQELQIIWDALLRQDDLPEHVDAIVIGGCRDIGLAQRAAELYHAGISKQILITGYRPGYMQVTEAELLAAKCVELGVPKEVIILEKEARNTGENIRLAARALQERNISTHSVILIHKPYMSLRFLATAQAQWPTPQPYFYATCQIISFEEYCRIHGVEDTATKLLGDLRRMADYAEQGYQTAQPIPAAAYTAYEQIIATGFTAR